MRELVENNPKDSPESSPKLETGASKKKITKYRKLFLSRVFFKVRNLAETKGPLGSSGEETASDLAEVASPGSHLDYLDFSWCE
jgi:hypothetical protein